MEYTWEEFTTFGGTLGKSVFQWDRTGLYDWLKALKSKPEQFGIPAVFLADVATLLNGFLVTSDVQHPDQVPYLRPVHVALTSSSETRADPITVHYGPDLSKLLIVDGASALGYLFSICRSPTARDLSWYSYWLPNLLLYSKCLYLAFLAVNTDKVDDKYLLSGVPEMANIMYLPNGRDHLQSQPMMLGSTLPSVSSLYKNDTRVVEQTRLAYVWRRENVLESALNELHPGTVLPGILHPPVFIELRKRLDWLIFGRKTATRAIERALCPELFQESYAIAIEILRSVGAQQHQLIKQDQVACDTRSSKEMESLFKTLFQLRFTRNYHPGDRKIPKAWRDLFQFYLTPRIHPKVGTVYSNIPIPVPQKALKRIEDLVDGVIPRLLDAANQKLDHIVQERDEDTGRGRKIKTGRCAEVHLVVCISSKYFHNMKNHIDKVRGLALEIRGIGLSTLFQTDDFRLSTLRNVLAIDFEGHVTEKGPSRYPCDNCREVLSCFGIRARVGEEYDTDIHMADVRPY